MMTLNILISCYNDSVSDVPEIFLSPRDDIRYIVSHQMSPDYAEAHPELSGEIASAFGRTDVVYSSFIGRGISRNRNHSLDALVAFLRDEAALLHETHLSHGGHLYDSKAVGDVYIMNQLCVLADDDVRYADTMPDLILGLFDRMPDTDVICGKIETPSGQPEFKDYPPASHRVVKVPVYGSFYFSSVEVSFRLAPVLAAGIRFDERFGLGSDLWPEGGEDPIFLSDCLSAGLRLVYVPEYVVIHPYLSTGKKGKTIRKAQMLEAVAVRCRGRNSPAAFVGRLRVSYRRLLAALHLL